MKAWIHAAAAAALVTFATPVHAQTNILIESFGTPGNLTFSKLGTEVIYRVEWSSAAGQAWTNFGLPALDTIISAGTGTVTVSVPMLYRVVAVLPPDDMALIPAGSFVMGDTFGEGDADELPLHTNYVSSFYMDKTEVTKAHWDSITNWAATNGYTFATTGAGKDTDHPVTSMSWVDTLKWANARSQFEGLMPCYTNADGSVYTNGAFAGGCNWSASGYRLPTEAEWEKAARGGSAGHRFAWTDSDTIQHARANYQAWTNGLAYDTSPTDNFHPSYDDLPYPYTSPVGSFAPNGYGLYDMTGNVKEMCWDVSDASYYSVSPGVDPRGPDSGSQRVTRGGAWGSFADEARNASRTLLASTTAIGGHELGFRLVRRAP